MPDVIQDLQGGDVLVIADGAAFGKDLIIYFEFMNFNRNRLGVNHKAQLDCEKACGSAAHKAVCRAHGAG